MNAAPPAHPTGDILHAIVSKTFGGLSAVKDVELRVPPGAIISLIGPNGAGKTTFFNVIAGILEPTSGFVDFDGTRVIGRPTRARIEPLMWFAPSALLGGISAVAFLATSSTELAMMGALAAIVALILLLLAAILRPRWYRVALDQFGVFRSARPHEMAKAGIGRTFQNIRLFANMTAMQNVQVGMHLKLKATPVDGALSTPLSRAEEKESRAKAIHYLTIVGLAGRAGELAKNLPYGDQRRLEIARALAGEPVLLLLDEPTAGMNPQETKELTELIARLRRDLGLSFLLIEHDMKVVMRISDRVTVIDHGERIAEGTPEEVRGNERVVEAYLGKPAASQISRRVMPASNGPEGDEPLLQVTDVHAYYGRIQALHGITLEVRSNEIVTLIGSNGAGKTTTLKVASGLLHPRKGSVRFEGRDISRTSAHRLVRGGVCHVPEGRGIFPRLTVLENLQMGAFAQPGDTFAANLEYVYGIFPRLKERSAQSGGSLSGGEQQMLAIGRALMANPRLLLLDEPSLGLAPILVQQIF
jgi:ABC-type branched-subunit amino acid transport system ATPase component